MYLKALPEDAVQIEGSYDYIDKKGNVYGIENRHNNKHQGMVFVKSQHTVYGYKYCGIRYKNGKVISKRVHRLVANAFIQNPNNLPIVMHIDNNKSNNDVSNLLWGTISENTKNAYRSNLINSKNGFDDEQSIPIDQYDTVTNNLIATYGSVSQAAKSTGISVGGILFQCRTDSAKIRKKSYFVFHGCSPRHHDIVVAYDIKTDREVARFANTRFAEEYFGISHVSDMIFKGKQKWSKHDVWFKRIEI